MVLRLTWAITLFALSCPGLLFWMPVAITTFIGVHEFKKTGPVWDTWDEIAQYKLVYGLISGVCVWLGAMLLTLPFAPLTGVLVPVLMWLSLRWFEDAVAAARALVALARLALVGPHTLARLRAQRAAVHARLSRLATERLGLPDEPERVYVGAAQGEGRKGRVEGGWRAGTGYFSLRRRRKRDWAETLRLHDGFDYPGDEDS
jgi:glycerol-3-phosphate O-acyltransferase/dihydroxyacetone phosphate acyltransferase